MRVASIFYSGVLILAACLLESSSAVTCTADPTVAGCIDCTFSTNNVECLAEASSSNVDCNEDPFNSECVADGTTLKPPTGNGGQWTFPWEKVKKVLFIFK
ncbi:GD15103 [Drosophila simulans]|uniref:GD15103 n=1 Tax=Drosophila simulans TaxID=7240 RepID=B4NTB6_DROSI|nr:GD15103 [Drosophila simulans]